MDGQIVLSQAEPIFTISKEHMFIEENWKIHETQYSKLITTFGIAL